MDASRFDRLSRALSTRTRRNFSRTVAGLALAGELALLPGIDEAVTKKKRRKKKKCKGETKRCGKRCIPVADCCVDEDCGPPSDLEICVDGKCICGTRRGLTIQAC